MTSNIRAAAYLTEHHDDDSEPVTEEWLRSVGFEGEAYLVYHRRVPCLAWAKGGTRFGDSATGWYIPSVCNRGYIRSYCRMFGVELRETKGT